ncbi:MAG TPA: sulfur oxidation c-type cytochrome SoxA [Candidatus Methylomirabilis sp.]|nr:sulfur oxidation c-type cytochrome SoxA [Candidatus Methylomirabilis sp.]
MRGSALVRVLGVVVAVPLAAGCAGRDPKTASIGSPRPPWVSRAVPEGKGEITTLPDGKTQAVRYPGWTSEDFSRFRTYAYDDHRPAIPVAEAPMPAITGDPTKGRRLFLDRNLGPCTGCHLIQGGDVWPAGNVGPDLSTYGDRKLPAEYTFNLVYDPRHLFPQTVMPPWGAAGLLKPDDIVHIVAFLDTQKGPLRPEKDAERDPNTRARPVGFGDNLDPTNNPAVLRAEGADQLWSSKGPAGKACADCHAGGALEAMKGVATRYPRFVARYRRVMSIEDFLTVHAPETTGAALLEESGDNLDLTMRIKMASNGMTVNLDLEATEIKAALARGEASFRRKVGQRNHACADCHTTDGGRGADKFLGGRVLANADKGLTRHFPTWRTSQADVWDMRKRMQWCMTPLGTNMLAADAVEYAEMELFLTSFDQGKAMSVPGIRH